ncbi:hypothetical protein [Burkholderia ambifaria]|uniref:hypothetical protein n=1 Tax=Burkholderia ambifaria TaxID=152480 RepID=UPI00158E6587|nr:hypothetical protein [Burkholderia ambifaria]
MKAVTAAAVATATVASNLSYAQPVPASDLPAALPGGLRYAQPDDAPQMAPALTSRLNSAQQAGSPTNQSVSPQGGKEATKMISRPKTPIEFVRNLKVIFDHDLLLRDDFYTDASLKNAFNLEDTGVIRTDEEKGDRRISVISSHFLSIFPWVKIPGRDDFMPSAQLVGGKTTHQSGAVTAGVNFGMREGGPNFDETKRIFGGNFVFLMPEPSPHGGPPAATAPHGNETWKYQRIDGKAERNITISFNPSGELSNIIIELMGK